MSSSKCRLKINLEDFFNDERKYSYILLRPDWEYVKNLKNHIKKLFSINNINLITEDCVYLPSNESIKVISEGEIIKVVKKQSVLYPDKNNSQSNNIFSLKSISTKKDTTHLQNSLSQEIKNSKSKLKNFLDNVETKTVENNCIEEENLMDYSIEQTNENQIHTVQESFHVDGDEPTHNRKRKRIRKRTRKTKTENDDIQLNLNCKNQKILNKCFTVGNVLSKTSGSHIKFCDDGTAMPINNKKSIDEEEIEQNFKGEEEEDDDDDDDECKTVFKDYLDDVPGPRFVKSTYVGTKNVIILENKCIKPANEVISEYDEDMNQQPVTENTKNDSNIKLYSNGNAILSIENGSQKTEGNQPTNLNDSGMQSSAMDLSVMIQSGNGLAEKTINVSEFLKISKPLNTLPDPGDILIFKIYRLNERYEPGLSEYVCGKVEEIENDTKLIKIFIIEGHDEFKEIEGKFSLPDVTVNDVPLEFVYLQLEDMIDRKFVKL